MTLSSLEMGEEVQVVGMPPEEEYEHEMFMLIHLKRRQIAFPLANTIEKSLGG